MVGGPDEDACPRELTITETTFRVCTVRPSVGEGGSLAIFDTTAMLTNCVFEGGGGAAVLFESSSAGGEHKLNVSVSFFMDV